MGRLCETCGAKHASFGTPAERKKRWCGGCGTAHGAVNLVGRLCETLMWGQARRVWYADRAHTALVWRLQGRRRGEPA